MDTLQVILVLLTVASVTAVIASTVMRRIGQNAINQALASASRSLVDQTEERIRSQQQVEAERSEAAQRSIGSLLSPLEAKLTELDGHVRELERSRAGAYAKLDQQVTDTRALLDSLRTETGNLNAALRRSDTRGRWGELQLERVIELAGMTQHVAYERQVRQTGDGAGRPDVTVHLTDGHVLYIDAKVPLAAFHDAVASSDPELHRQHLLRHAQALSGHVGELEKRRYTKDERSLPFMVLFVPTEASLAAAAEADPRLIESALERGIAIASPTSLAMMLTNIALSWRQEIFATNAREILREVQELHGRLETFASHLQKAGSGLQAAVSHYNRAVGSFEARLRPAARSIEAFGAVDHEITRLDEITTIPRGSSPTEAHLDTPDQDPSADRA